MRVSAGDGIHLQLQDERKNRFLFLHRSLVPGESLASLLSRFTWKMAAKLVYVCLCVIDVKVKEASLYSALL